MNSIYSNDDSDFRLTMRWLDKELRGDELEEFEMRIEGDLQFRQKVADLSKSIIAIRAKHRIDLLAEEELIEKILPEETKTIHINSKKIIFRSIAVAASILLIIFLFYNQSTIEPPPIIAKAVLDVRDKRLSTRAVTRGEETISDFDKLYEPETFGELILLFEDETNDSIRRDMVPYVSIAYVYEEQFEKAQNLFKEIIDSNDGVFSQEDVGFAKWYYALSLALYSEGDDGNYDTKKVDQAFLILSDLEENNPQTVKRGVIPKVKSKLKPFTSGNVRK